MDKLHTCCFFGHRKVIETTELNSMLCDIIQKMISDEGVDTFLFGSKSQFDDICHKLVTKAKEKHPHIKRVYVRAEYPYINQEYKNELLKYYEDTYFPEEIMGAGRAVYIKRNYEMINNSKFCVVYYDEENSKNTKSGTAIAYDYALKKGLDVINCRRILKAL